MKKKGAIKLNKEIYLKNVASRWKTELKMSDEVYILSPCLTLPIVKDLILNGPISNKFYNYYGVYTLLNFENFLKEKSSIKAIKYLIENNVDVYSLSNLHAPILLVSDNFVSIGSQNLTNWGIKNKEATFTSSNLEIVNYIEQEIVQNWLKDRKRITLEIVNDIEKSLQPLKKYYKQLVEDIEKARQGVEEKENLRQEEKKETERKRKERLYNLEENIKCLEKTLSLIGKVKKIEGSYTFFSKNDLLEGKIKDKKVNLHNTGRYLAIIENTGKLCWARTVKTRITQYCNSLPGTSLTINEKEYSVNFKANWDPKTLCDYNLEIELNPNEFQRFICKIQVWYDLNNFEIFGIKVVPKIPDLEWMLSEILPQNATDSFRGIKTWIENNEEIFKEDIALNLLRPFKYTKNLAREKAIDFLGYEKKCDLKIGIVKNQNVLIFRILD